MKKISYFARRSENIKIIGAHTEKYRPLMFVLASLLTALGLFFVIYWNFDENSAGEVLDLLYLYGDIAFTVISASLILFLFLNKKKKISTHLLARLINLYVLFVFVYGTTMCVFDLGCGASPLVYLLILAAVAGLFVVEPVFFTILVFISYNIIMTFVFINHYLYFEGMFRYENLINLLLFTLVTIVSVFRHYEVTIREFRALKRLEEMSYIDELTGLLNERSYVDEVERINKLIKEEKIQEFAVILMDVNNLKNTNDKYGHRFGCHLVVNCGHELPNLFKTSKLFHIGGDEFMAIVYGDDYKEFDQRLDEFGKNFTYKIINYDGVDLIFSVARGYSKYEKGDLFKDVLQRADSAMYVNKKEVKEKYHIGGR
ncbi:MAG: GGDEF domain-containing protein [Bacilli bacterium]|nr:GGDEF domain-containing protein [Bacilli bacterium]